MKINTRAEVGVGVKPLAAPLVRHVPNSKRFVVARREEVLPSGVPGDAPHPVVVAGEGEQANSGGHVPNFYRFIPRTRGQKRADNPGAHVVSVIRRPAAVNGRSSFFDGRGGRFRRPGYALYHVVVFAQFGFAIFGLC